MEDSKNALFVEPNAYIKNFNNKNRCEVKPIKKVVFSEPYDCMPNFYFDNHFQKNENGYFDNHFQKNRDDCFVNNFHKGDCDCVSNTHQQNCNWNKEKRCTNHDCNCNQGGKYNDSHKKSNLNFDIKNLMPILSGFNKGVGGLDFNSLSSLLNSGGGFDFSKLLGNPQLITSVMSMFANKKKINTKKDEIICTDYEIKRYTKV